MTTANHVVNQRGQVLLPKNTQLSEKHIQGLRSWSIRFVDVLAGGSADSGNLTEEQEEQLTRALEQFFSHNSGEDDHPLMEQLRELRRMHLLGKLSVRAYHEVPTPILSEKWLTVLHIVQNAGTLVTIPAIHRKLLTEINRPNVSISEIGDIIALDPGLSARIIKMANSAWYGMNHRLETVSRAVSVIGFDDIKTMFNETVTAEHFSTDTPINATPVSYWSHSIATSVFTQVIAEHIQYPEIEQLSLLGLLHDIGKQLLYYQIPKLYAQIGDFAWQEQLPSLKVERKFLGFYHTLVAMELLKHWNFSKACQDIVYFHHNPENATHKLEAYVIHLADAIANSMGSEVHEPAILPPVDLRVLNELHLRKKQLPAIVAQGTQRLQAIYHLLSI